MTHVAAQARVPKKGLFVFLAVAALLLLLGAAAVARNAMREESTVEIVSVVDGNTVVVNADGRQRTVVMGGLRAAVRNPDGLSVGPEFCMGEQSYVWLRDRLPQGALASLDTRDDGAPEGMEAATFTLGGKDVNVEMAEAGMAAPTGVGVSSGTADEIAQATRVAVDKGVGLYSVEEECTLNHQLYESTYALENMPTDAADTIKDIDAKAVEYADLLDSVRLVQQDIQHLDAERGTFTDLAYAPAREALLAEVDPAVDKGLQVLRDLNERRNEMAAQAAQAAQRG